MSKTQIIIITLWLKGDCCVYKDKHQAVSCSPLRLATSLHLKWLGKPNVVNRRRRPTRVWLKPTTSQRHKRLPAFVLTTILWLNESTQWENKQWEPRGTWLCQSSFFYFFMVQFGSLEQSCWLLPDFNSVNNAALGQHKQAVLQIRFGYQSSTVSV